MDSHWDRLKAKRNELTEDVHARNVAFQCTQYEWSAVRSAFLAYCDAHDECLDAYRAICERVDALVPLDQRYVGWELSATDEVKHLLGERRRAKDDNFKCPEFGGHLNHQRQHSHERYPLTRWARETKAYQRSARIMRNALAPASAVCA